LSLCSGGHESSCSPDHEFMCVSDHKCIHTLLRCDGIEHCHDGSDELNCVGPGRLYYILPLRTVLTCSFTGVCKMITNLITAKVISRFHCVFIGPKYQLK